MCGYISDKVTAILHVNTCVQAAQHYRGEKSRNNSELKGSRKLPQRQSTSIGPAPGVSGLQPGKAPRTRHPDVPVETASHHNSPPLCGWQISFISYFSYEFCVPFITREQRDISVMMYDARQETCKAWVLVRRPASVRTGANDRRFKATWCSPAMHDMNQALAQS